MNPLVVIVPGLEAPKWRRPFLYIIVLYVRIFKLNAGKRSWMLFAEYANSHTHARAVVVEPIYWFSKKDIAAAAKELARTVETHAAEKIILFGFSLGGEVIERALSLCSGTSHVIKVISVAAPHARSTFSAPGSIPVVNIYSDADTYLKFSSLMLYGRVYMRLNNAENIQIDNVRHGGFSAPALWDFYLKKILN